MVTLHREDADVHVPDGSEPDVALERTTDLAIGAHQDDLEIMAIAPISECRASPDRWFTGVVCTDGAGSPRSGPYAGVADAEMVGIRREEQWEAADIGDYSAVVQLGYPSDVARELPESLLDDLHTLLVAAEPTVVYTHNLADRHTSHVAVAVATVDAIRRLPEASRPGRVLGIEGWGSLDWLDDEDKVGLSSPDDDLGYRIVEVFDSQISGGKRYDLAALGRRRANATYGQPREVDADGQVTLAMDLTPLVEDDDLDPWEHLDAMVRRFEAGLRIGLEPYRRRWVTGG